LEGLSLAILLVIKKLSSSLAVIYKVCKPASENIKIQKAIQVHNADFRLYNTAGQMILQKHLTDNNTEINVSSLPAGTYIYNILQDGKQVETGKIVIDN